jgi:anti-sigma regulatory factor (Ser/Thr protein kinase)
MNVTALRAPDVRTYRFVVPNAPDAAKLSRDHVAWLVAHARCPVDVGVAKLLVSEVVTNAHRHTESPLVDLSTTIRPDSLRVSVRDMSPLALPAPRQEVAVPAMECGGRGLLLLQRFAKCWGCDLHGEGQPFAKSVWFELAV